MEVLAHNTGKIRQQYYISYTWHPRVGDPRHLVRLLAGFVEDVIVLDDEEAATGDQAHVLEVLLAISRGGGGAHPDLDQGNIPEHSFMICWVMYMTNYLCVYIFPLV